MSLKEEKIIELITKNHAMQKTEILLDSEKIDISELTNFWKGEITLKSIIESYHCMASIKGSEIVEYHCNCSKCINGIKMCAHVGAMLLKYIKKGKKDSSRVVYTSPEADKLIRAGKKRALEGYRHQEDMSNLGLSYDIRIENDTHAIELYVTKNKKRFHIDNLNKFEENFTYGISESYNWKSSLLHQYESFKEEFRPMLKFILSNVRRNRQLDKIYETGRNRYYEKNEGKLFLLGSDFDEFMRLCYENGGTIIYRTVKSRIETKINMTLTDNNPELFIKLESIDNAGYNLRLMGIDLLVCGEKRLYILQDSLMYMADEEYTLAMKEFLLESVRANYNKDSKSYSLVIGKKDMAAFTNLILNNVRKYCKVNSLDVDMEEFNPWPLEVSFIIQADSFRGVLICRVRTAYKGENVDLFGHINDFTGVCRDYHREAKLKSIILKYFAETEEKNVFETKDYKQIFGLIKSGISELQGFGEVEISDEVLDYKIVDSMKINANVSMEGRWLKLDIDAGQYSKEELEQLLISFNQKEKYMRLNDNTFVKLDDNGLELLAQMAYDLDFSATDIINHQVFIPKYRALYLDGRLREGELAAYDKDIAFKALVRTIKQVEDSEFMVPEELEDILRPYQKYGFHWLRTLDACGFGGILADDMGLGKTLQIITLLLDEKLSVSRNIPSLIVAPASLIYNWDNEIKRFAPELRTMIVTGTKEKRRELLEKYGEQDVLITSYELLKRDIQLYEGISFRFQVIDEAQSIKNFSTDNAKCVKKIAAQTRFALTGTPIENRLSELWSIFDFLMPDFLYSYKKFSQKFEQPIAKNGDVGAMKGLNRMISPFVLRRLKKDVLKELPEKQEYDVYTKLQGKQHKLYVANALRLKAIIEGTEEGEFNDKRMQILSELMKLRQICCDPALCYMDYNDGSSKLDMCIDMIKNGVAGGHRILLFSQFTSMLDIIESRLEEEGITFYKLTGATAKAARVKLVEQFNNDDTSVFLISLKAGGVGLNLTGADMVIHYDPWWNVAAENQASDRAHRIGQSKVVSVFKLISKDTIEERIRQLQTSKAKLADNVLSGETISLGSLSKSELLSILDV